MTAEVVERDRFRRPRQTPRDNFHKFSPDLRRAACHAVHLGRQGRPVSDVHTRGFIRVHASQPAREQEKHIPTTASYPIMGDNTVETVRYTEPKQSADKGLVWINQKQYFKGVPPEVWNLYLGGCQICEKWLKDREGGALTNKDIRQYQRIVMALKETIELMAGIDVVLRRRQFSQEKLSNAVHN